MGRRRTLAWLWGTVLCITGVYACGNDDERYVCCDPSYSHYDEGWCRVVRKSVADDSAEAGIIPPKGYDYCDVYRDPSLLDNGDAGDGGDAGEEGDAGDEPDAQAPKTKACVDNEPDFFDRPQPVWFGPAELAPKECPKNVGAYGGRQYFDLFIPADDGCPKCACGEIEGSCSPNVETVHFRADKCGVLQTTTTDFSPPENWDGSCTNNHVIAEGLECPPGSGNPCVQAEYVSALPNPVQGCKPIELPVLKAIYEAPKWNQIALSCSPTYTKPEGDDSDGTQATSDKSKTCFNRPEGWRSCVHSLNKGVYDCDPASSYNQRIVTYPEKAILNHRSCSACECETSGGACYGAIQFYEDEACSALLVKEGLSSDSSECHNFYPPGSAIGSVDMTDLLYVAGSCTPQGGVPIGDVTLDETDAVTWCCLAKEPEPIDE